MLNKEQLGPLNVSAEYKHKNSPPFKVTQLFCFVTNIYKADMSSNDVTIFL